MERGITHAQSEQRGLLEGVRNVVLFNWPRFAAAAAAVVVPLVLASALDYAPELFLTVAVLAALPLALSLVATAWVYDFSDLYRLPWLAQVAANGLIRGVVLVNAGYDEIGAQLSRRLPDSSLTHLDFFDPERTSEASIRRARLLYPVSPETVVVEPHQLPLAAGTVDLAVAFMSVHELRQRNDRIALFSELRRSLRPNGRVVVVEHTRSLANLLAYSVGAFHFFSTQDWMAVFEEAGLRLEMRQFHTPLVSTFILRSVDA